MKRLSLLVLLSLTLLPIGAMAADFESTISADATINKEVAPDTVSIKFYVENTGLNVAEVKEKNDKTVNAAINEIKKHLGANDSVRTISYRINNIYSYKDKIKVFQKYEVVNGFEVKLKDLSKISRVIKTATDNGVKRVEQLNFSVSDSENICNNLMAQTAQMAKKRAQFVANGIGSDILKPKSVNTYCSLSSSYVQPRAYSNKMVASGSMDTMAMDEGVVESIEPGSINVRANANMVYYLK